MRPLLHQIGRVWQLTERKWLAIVLLVANALYLSLSVVFIPEAYRQLALSVQQDSSRAYYFSLLLYVGAIVLDILASTFLPSALDVVGARLTRDAKHAYLRSALALPFKGSVVPEGELYPGLLHALPQALGLVNRVLRQSIHLIAAACLIFGYLAFLQPLYAGALLVSGILRLAVMYRFMQHLDRQVQAEQSALVSLSADLHGLLASTVGLRAYAVEDYLAERFHRLNAELNRAQRAQAPYRTGMDLTNDLFSEGTTVGLQITISLPLFAGQNSFADLSAISRMGYQANPQVFDAAYDLAQVVPGCRVGAQRVDPVLGFLPEAGGAALPASITSLELRELSFSYDGARPVLCRVSLDMRAGDRVLITGESGCGKSTLLYLLCRAYEPDAGELLVNGVPSQSYDRSLWHKQIVLLPQMPTLFRGTIEDNIRAGRPGASSEEVCAAAERAMIHGEIASMSLGYQTVLQEDSVNISTGQRQRIALARILLMQPSVLLLDEPTAALDALNEHAVIQLLSLLPHDTTVVMSSHSSAFVNVGYIRYTMHEGSLTALGVT